MLTQFETLKFMGIDIWTLQKEGVHSVESGLELQAQTLVDRREKENEEISTLEQKSETPSFRFAMLHYGSFAICLALGNEDLPRKFCDDVAGVMAADVEVLKFHLIEWPLLNTLGVDQSAEAAARVVTQKFRALPDKVLVIGSEVIEYFRPLEKANDSRPVLIGGQSYILFSSVTQVLRSAEKKRRLMALLASWN